MSALPTTKTGMREKANVLKTLILSSKNRLNIRYAGINVMEPKKKETDFAATIQSWKIVYAPATKMGYIER